MVPQHSTDLKGVMVRMVLKKNQIIFKYLKRILYIMEFKHHDSTRVKKIITLA